VTEAGAVPILPIPALVEIAAQAHQRERKLSSLKSSEELSSQRVVSRFSPKKPSPIPIP
jgi:hypothetical protein